MTAADAVGVGGVRLGLLDQLQLRGELLLELQ